MDVGGVYTHNAAPILTPGGGGETEALYSVHVHSDAPATSTMSANTKGEIAVTSDWRLALSAARPGQSHRMTAENTLGRVIRREETDGVWELFTNVDSL